MKFLFRLSYCLVLLIALSNCGSPTPSESRISVESREGEEGSKEGRERRIQETDEKLLSHPNPSIQEVFKQEQAKTSKSYRDEKIMADLRKQLEQKRAKEANLAKLEQELDKKISNEEELKKDVEFRVGHHPILGDFIEIVSSPVSFQFGEKGKEETVKLLRAFSLMKVPVTQGMLKALNVIKNPSHFKGDDRPVEMVSFEDVQRITGELNKRNDGYHYDLPTEEEWEFAARGGVEGEEYLGGSYKKTLEYAWVFDNSDQTHPVGQKKPNGFGLYDMIGNVWEWTKSFWSSNSTDRVFRGGSFCGSEGFVVVANRHHETPDYRYNNVGFRLLRTKK